MEDMEDEKIQDSEMQNNETQAEDMGKETHAETQEQQPRKEKYRLQDFAKFSGKHKFELVFTINEEEFRFSCYDKKKKFKRLAKFLESVGVSCVIEKIY